ncbi:MAG: hypothetical protein WCE94_01665 [Candidatus Methanoperedens sp.]
MGLENKLDSESKYKKQKANLNKNIILLFSVIGLLIIIAAVSGCADTTKSKVYTAQSTPIQSTVQKPSVESTTIEKPDEYIYKEGAGAPVALLKISSATSTSIQLQHQGGDSLKLSELQFTVKKANEEVLKPSVSSKSESNVIAVGDTIILSGVDFGKSGDTIEITVTYKRMNIDIVWIKALIRQNSG